MRIIILLASLFAFSAHAGIWNDLEINQSYKLGQSFELPVIEGDIPAVNFTEGEEVVLKDIVPLDMISVVLFIFDYKNCPGQNIKTDMEIIPVQNVEIGALLEKGCQFEIYIETRDIYSESLFK